MSEHPNHYDADGEDLWDRIMPLFGPEALYQHHIINAIEYAVRAKNKNGSEDLEKAIVNLRRANGILTHIGLD
jgi:hypothetical protein